MNTEENKEKVGTEADAKTNGLSGTFKGSTGDFVLPAPSNRQHEDLKKYNSTIADSSEGHRLGSLSFYGTPFFTITFCMIYR